MQEFKAKVRGAESGDYDSGNDWRWDDEGLPIIPKSEKPKQSPPPKGHGFRPCYQTLSMDSDKEKEVKDALLEKMMEDAESPPMGSRGDLLRLCRLGAVIMCIADGSAKQGIITHLLEEELAINAAELARDSAQIVNNFDAAVVYRKSASRVGKYSMKALEGTRDEMLAPNQIDLSKSG